MYLQEPPRGDGASSSVNFPSSTNYSSFVVCKLCNDAILQLDSTPDNDIYDNTVRSGAEECTFWGARLDVLIFRLRSYRVLIKYSAECNGPKFHKTLMFLGQAGMFLSFQARRSSATRSSTSDLTVYDDSCKVENWTWHDQPSWFLFFFNCRKR